MRILFVGLLTLSFYTCSRASFFNSSLETFWSDFKKKFGKEYSGPDQDAQRRLIWESNLKEIEKHNQDAKLGKHQYTLKMNKYGDMTNEEFRKVMNGFKYSAKTKSDSNTYSGPSNLKLPDSVDWRTQGFVTPIKDQGQCGSCWAFSAVASLEGQHFKQSGKMVSLSEQNLVDCSGKYGNMGCNGGLMDNSFKYIKENGGIDAEDSYPYEAMDGKCRFKPKDVGATDTGFVDLKSGDENALTNALATIGPISVAIDAGQMSFQFYSAGIYSDDECSSIYLDHGVTAVGYGSDKSGQEYYIVKNSWGTSWGDQGYILIARNRENMCGIATAASYPLV